ncbi:hypothetical protein JCM10020v2_000354 [Rhodotorula toruloides]
MGIPLDRFKFSWEVQDFVKCAGCRQVAYEPYFICPNEHVKCAACIQPPAAPIVGAVAAPPPAGPVAANCGVCSRALLAQPRPSPLLKRTIEARTIIYSQLSTHYDTCPEKKIECPQGGKICGGRASHGFRKRRLMPKHLETECAQWKCRATKGCPTKTTSANLEAHEKACRVANDKFAQLKQSIKEKQASNELLSNEVDRLSKIAVFYDELMEKRSSMINSTTMTDKEVTPAAKTAVSTQGVKRSLRLASKRGPPDGPALDGAAASSSSVTGASTTDLSRSAKTRRTEASLLTGCAAHTPSRALFPPSSSSSQLGKMGVDLGRFVDKEVPQHLRCPACLEAAYPPVLVCWSEHALCRQCADRFVANESYACPTCRQRMVFPLKPSLFIKRAIEGYKIKCENDGCSWTGTVVNEEQHSDSCPFRKVFCRLCDSRYVFSQRDEHLDVCTEKTIDCPQGGKDCGGRSSGGRKKRRLMQEHLDKECAHWQCRAVPDCKTRTMRANLDEHEKGCRAAHEEILHLKRTVEENAKLAEQRVPDKIVEMIDFATSTDKALLAADEQQMFTSTSSSQVVSTYRWADMSAELPKRFFRSTAEYEEANDYFVIDVYGDPPPAPTFQRPRILDRSNETPKKRMHLLCAAET